MRPRKVPSAPSLIPESHRDRRESIECCHFSVTFMSICCRFDSTFFGGGTRGKGFVFSVEGERAPSSLRTMLTPGFCQDPTQSAGQPFPCPIHTSMIANK